MDMSEVNKSILMDEFNVLFISVHYAPIIPDCCKEDLLCSVLIVSDQLLVTRLKEMCEMALTNICNKMDFYIHIFHCIIYEAFGKRGGGGGLSMFGYQPHDPKA